MVNEGASVTFRQDSDTEELSGIVSKVQSGITEGMTLITITPTDSFTEDERGLGGRVSIELQSTAGEALVVPIASITGTVDGLAILDKVQGRDAIPIKVRAGLSANGFVEVVPVDPGSLQVGDDVVVGR